MSRGYEMCTCVFTWSMIAAVIISGGLTCQSQVGPFPRVDAGKVQVVERWMRHDSVLAPGRGHIGYGPDEG